eukprot:1897115-Amphidinium_carterae.1
MQQNKASVLEWASENLKNDRELMLTAVQKQRRALQWASSALMEDSSFAIEVKSLYRILRIRMISGRLAF